MPPKIYPKPLVYCLSNPSYMANVFKIGRTDILTAKERAEQLYKRAGTALATPFCVEFAKRVTNASYVEAEAHRFFSKYRVNGDREFFQVPLGEILRYFEEEIDGEWDPPPSYIPLMTSSVVSKISNSLPRNITLQDIKIVDLAENERQQLLEVGMKREALELKTFKDYYFFSRLQRGEPRYLTSDMQFSATLNSPYSGYISVRSDTFYDVIQDLTRYGPQSFIELRQLYLG